MTYITQTLAKDETLLAEGKISKWSLFHIYCAAVIFGLSIICLPISAALLLYAYLKIRSTEMGITSKRVIRKSGVIMRDTSEIRLNKVESVSVKQGFLGRIFGYGDVIISGSGGNNAVMKGVKDPLAFRNKVQESFEHAQRISPKFEIKLPIDLNPAAGMSIDQIAEMVATEIRKQGGAA
jgi:membrane protein YdbS with pleckstrin-like domain